MGQTIAVRVQTRERAMEILSLCDEKGIKVIVGVESDKPEDISSLERFNNHNVRRNNPEVGRNDSCPCGSGKKYKKCCLDKGTS